eukprot:1271024-Prymnesium_polylepis.1
MELHGGARHDQQGVGRAWPRMEASTTRGRGGGRGDAPPNKADQQQRCGACAASPATVHGAPEAIGRRGVAQRPRRRVCRAQRVVGH